MYIIPKPQEWILGTGDFYISYDDVIAVGIDCGNKIVKYALDLQNYIHQEIGFELCVSKGELSSKAIKIYKKKNLKNQEYFLIVNEEGICILASEDVGIFYGIQTLKQILRQTGAKIPYMSIHDYPDIPVRGLFYDVTRSRIPTLEYMKQMIDFMAEYKLNQLHLYIEHTFMFQNLSEMWRDDTPLTAMDILELDEYCSNRNIELVPSIATFGHLYKLLRTKEYCHLCELPELCDDEFGFADRMKHHTLDVSNTESMTLVKRLISEYMSLFRSDKFNICADETFDLGKGKSKSLADGIGVENLYINFVKELCEFLVENGKTPMFWGDIICTFPDAVKQLPQQTICLNWGYYEDLNDEAIRKFSENGVRQYCCPGVRGWNQFVNEMKASYGNIKRMCTYAVQYHAEGLLNTDWGDYGHINHPSFSISGIIYAAAFSWNKVIPTFEEINRQISKIEFQDSTETFVDIVAQISQNQVYQWRNAIWFMEGREGAFSLEQLEGIETVKQNLREIKNQLSAVVTNLKNSKRGLVQSYLVAVDGIILLQDLGSMLYEIDNSKAVREELYGLASKLETWFYYYKREWRKVSRESELYQIQNVVNYFADYLRCNGQVD